MTFSYSSGYLHKVHRPGNKVVFVHCIELPEMDLQRASKIFDFNISWISGYP